MASRFALLGAALFLVAAACGGGNGDAGERVASLSGATDDEVVAVPLSADEIVELTEEEALFAFTACLRDNGVDIEDPTVDADGNVDFSFRRGVGPQDEGFDHEATSAARVECSGLLEGVTLGFGGGDHTDFQDTLFTYAECMRDNDYEMDDPDFGNFSHGGGGQGDQGYVGPFGAIDPDDPAFVAAQEACSDILSGFGFGGGGGFRGGPGGGGHGGGGGGGGFG